jgi:sec-independent protein translocase protein TatB
MFNIGGGEVIVILLVALIVLGPQRLPGVARQAGKVLADLRRMSTGFQNELRTAFDDVDSDRRPTPKPVSPTAADPIDDAIGSAAENAHPPAPDQPGHQDGKGDRAAS